MRNVPDSGRNFTPVVESEHVMEIAAVRERGVSVHDGGRDGMDAEQIAKEIDARVRRSREPKYSAWRVGITQDPGDRRAQHKAAGRDITHWMQWQADELGDAMAVEAHFIERGMKGGTGGDMDNDRTTWVYIF
jgi:hypothetical protein